MAEHRVCLDCLGLNDRGLYFHYVRVCSADCYLYTLNVCSSLFLIAVPTLHITALPVVNDQRLKRGANDPLFEQLTHVLKRQA